MTTISELLNVIFKKQTDGIEELKNDSELNLLFDYEVGPKVDMVEFSSGDSSLINPKKDLPDEITVQKGDTIKSLADYLGISEDEFKRIYGVSTISKGQHLTKKTNTATNTTTTKPTTTNNSGYTEYKVKSGETLGGIANRNNTTVDAIIKLNGLKSADDIKADQVLKIPSSASTSTNTTTTKPTTTNGSQTQATQATTSKKLEDFMYAIRMKESSNDYSKINPSNYIGAYQFGEEALKTLGIYYQEGDQDVVYKKNDWGGYIKKNKYGITSISDFLSSKEKQDAVMIAMINKNWEMINDYKLEGYIGKTIAGVEMTVSGMIAGAHLVGIGNLRKFLKSNGKIIPHDGNRTLITEYIENYGGYDLGIK